MSRFFERIDRVLRRAVGVAEDAPTETNITPAPGPESEEPIKDETTAKLAAEIENDEVFLDEPPAFEDQILNVQDKIKTPAQDIPKVTVSDEGTPDVEFGENIKIVKDEL